MGLLVAAAWWSGARPRDLLADLSEDYRAESTQAAHLRAAGGARALPAGGRGRSAALAEIEDRHAALAARPICSTLGGGIPRSSPRRRRRQQPVGARGRRRARPRRTKRRRLVEQIAPLGSRGARGRRAAPAHRARGRASRPLGRSASDRSSTERHAIPGAQVDSSPRQPQEDLAVALRARQHRLASPRTREPERLRRAAHASPRRRRARAGSRTTPPLPTCSRPTSNCGLTSATIVARRRQHARRPPAARARSEMNETSIDREVGRRRAASRGEQVADVGPLEHDDARILAQRPGELAVADVDRDDARARRAAAGSR